MRRYNNLSVPASILAIFLLTQGGVLVTQGRHTGQPLHYSNVIVAFGASPKQHVSHALDMTSVETMIFAIDSF